MILYSGDNFRRIPEQLRVPQCGVQLRHLAMSAERLRQEDPGGRLQANRPGGGSGDRLL